MTPIRFSLCLIGVNLIALIFLLTRYEPKPSALLLATLASVMVSAVVQRWRFGRAEGPQARFDPLVVAAALATFDVVFIALLERSPA